MTEEFKSYLSPKTWVPLGFVLSILGGVVWLSVMWSDGKRNTDDIREIKVDIRELQNSQATLNTNFVRLEEILQRIDRRTEILDQHLYNR